MALKISNDDSNLRKRVLRDLLVTPSKKTSFGQDYGASSVEPFLMLSANKSETKLSLPLYYAKHALGLKKKMKRPTFDYVEPQVELRDNQRKPFMKALELLTEHQTVTLKTYPGSGKTIMCASLSAIACGITAVLVHLEVQPRQWKGSFERVFPSFEGKIWTVGDGECPDDVRVIICMIGRVHQVPKKLAKKVGCLIIDEAHLLCTPSRVDGLLFFEAPCVIVATATLERNDEMEKMIHLMVGKHCVLMINKTPHLIVRFDTGIDFVLRTDKRGKTNYSDLLNQKAMCRQRDVLFATLIKNNPHRKYIVLVSRKSHAESFQQLCEEMGIECDSLYGTKKKYQDSLVLIGTISKIGTAFDEETGCLSFKGVKSNTLILLESIKCVYNEKEIKKGNLRGVKTWEQVRGRAMRAEDACIVYAVDKDRISRSHFNSGKHWFEYTNGEVIKTSSVELKLP